MAGALIGKLEAVEQPRARHTALEVPAVEIDYYPLIGYALVDLGLVYSMVPDEQHIPRVQLIAAALDTVIHLAGNKYDELIKLMEMKVKLLSGSVLEMEIMITLAQISGSVYSSFHSVHLR